MVIVSSSRGQRRIQYLIPWTRNRRYCVGRRDQEPAERPRRDAAFRWRNSAQLRKLLFTQRAIQRETAGPGDEDRQSAAHDRDILQKISVLADLLRAGREFPISMCDCRRN